MEPSFVLELVLMLGAGFVAGFLNTVAGGGSLITLPVLIFLGIPGLEANATNRVAIMSQNILAVAGFQSKGVRLPKPYIFFLATASLGGGILGTLIALHFPDHAFNRMLSIIMVLVAVSMLRKSKGPHDLLVNESKTRKRWGLVSFFILGIYGGFLQAGIGFLVILSLSLIHGYSLVLSNYIKVFSALLYTGIALAIFAWMGVVHWKVGLILAIGQGLGGWISSRWQVKKGDRWIRPLVVASVVVLAIKLWFF